MPRVYWKTNAIDYIPEYQLRLRRQILRDLLETNGEVISLQRLKKINEEIKDFKRFLEFNSVDPSKWMNYI
jgi:hypothetical protein